jgi:hypothetical protein
MGMRVAFENNVQNNIKIDQIKFKTIYFPLPNVKTCLMFYTSVRLELSLSLSEENIYTWERRAQRYNVALRVE